MGLTPGSACGRAAVYSACVWRSLGPEVVSGLGVVRRVVMAEGSRCRGAPVNAKPVLSSEITLAALRGVMEAPGIPGVRGSAAASLALQRSRRPALTASAMNLSRVLGRPGKRASQTMPQRLFSRHCTLPPSSLTRLRTPPSPGRGTRPAGCGPGHRRPHAAASRWLQTAIAPQCAWRAVEQGIAHQLAQHAGQCRPLHHAQHQVLLVAAVPGQSDLRCAQALARSAFHSAAACESRCSEAASPRVSVFRSCSVWRM
jgi:hypothetical protein